MRIVCISDTHGRHREMLHPLPAGDVIVHAGDITRQSNFEEVQEFLQWLAAQPYKNRALVAGNHDRMSEADGDIFAAIMPSNVHYMQDSGCIIDGLKFWGSPVQPEFNNWAWNRGRGKDIARHWALIPEGTDVLITHGPAYGILDVVPGKGHLGCKDLRDRIEAIRPQLHVCGHLHSGYGESHLGETKMVNAASCDEDYRPVHAPIVVELPPNG